MALKLKRKKGDGTEFEYLKIIGIEKLNYINGTAEVVVGGYLNKEARDLELQPTWGKRYTLKKDVINLSSPQDWRPAIYEHLKKLPDFAGAVDL